MTILLCCIFVITAYAGDTDTITSNADLFLNSHLSANEKRKYTYTQESIAMLEKYNIAKNITEKWSETDTILRRDLLDILHNIKSRNHALYDYNSFKNAEEVNANIDVLIGPKEIYENDLPLKRSVLICEFGTYEEFNFADIEESSPDYIYAYIWYRDNLLLGRRYGNKLYAELDSEVTYSEAITLICRLLIHPLYEEEIIKETMRQRYLNDGYEMFHYAEEITLINSLNPIDACCPQISIEQLNDKIPAYEAMNLIARALFLPAVCGGDYVEIENFRYIMNLTIPAPEVD